MPDDVRLRCLNEDGIREFEAWIAGLASKPHEPAPVWLLEHDGYSHEFPLGDVALERRRFASRGDFARYLNCRFEAARIFHDVDVDGMWEWLSLFYIEDTCPKQRDGTRRVYRSERHVIGPTTESRRHILRNAYMIFRQVGLSDTMAADLLMCQPVDRYAHVITHWAFDNGMFSVGSNYAIQVLPQTKANARNRWIARLDGRRLRLPPDPDFAPSRDALEWHAANVRP